MCDTRKTLIQKIYPDAQLPAYGSSEAVGADVCAYLTGIRIEDLRIRNGYIDQGRVLLRPGGRCLVPTGLRIKPADGFEIQVRSRSGLPLKTGLIVGNSPGTIDPDYTGPLGIILINTDPEDEVYISHGERIAQLVLTPVHRLTSVTTEVVTSDTPLKELISTDRGDGGFGSTGSDAIASGN